jgi:hypothetical protein
VGATRSETRRNVGEEERKRRRGEEEKRRRGEEEKRRRGEEERRGPERCRNSLDVAQCKLLLLF